MNEFLVRWLLVGGATSGILSLLTRGTLTGGPLGGGAEGSTLLAGVLVGFLNAFLRPLVLRWSGENVCRDLGLFLLVLNLGIFLTIPAWVQGVVLVDTEQKVGTALLISLVSWGVSSFFRAPNGRFHLVSFHGAPESGGGMAGKTR